MTARTALMCALVGIAFIQGRSAAYQSMSEANREAALTAFHARVGAYQSLHRELEASLPTLERSRDVWSMFLARRYLAAAIRAARPSAKEGDIFTPQVRRVFRELIAEALQGRDVAALLADLQGENFQLPHAVPRVNDSYPRGATHEVPTAVLQRLPALDGDLQYRVVNDSLVLWDSHADLVVDVLPRAFAGALETT